MREVKNGMGRGGEKGRPSYLSHWRSRQTTTKTPRKSEKRRNQQLKNYSWGFQLKNSHLLIDGVRCLFVGSPGKSRRKSFKTKGHTVRGLTYTNSLEPIKINTTHRLSTKLSIRSFAARFFCASTRSDHSCEENLSVIQILCVDEEEVQTTVKRVGGMDAHHRIKSAPCHHHPPTVG